MVACVPLSLAVCIRLIIFRKWLTVYLEKGSPLLSKERYDRIKRQKLLHIVISLNTFPQSNLDGLEH